MAFRSFTTTSRDAGTVTLRADTGEFNAKVEAAERQWRDSVGSMSREALKLDLAQQRLKRSLATYGAESAQAKRATIGLRDAEDQAARAADRATREYQQQERAVGRLSRGALAGSGVFHGLGRSVAFASGTFLGGAGLVYALRSTIQAGREAEASQGRVAVAVRNAGLDYKAYSKQIRDTIEAQSRLSAFDDEDLADSFGRLVTRTKDVSEALKDTALAADVARGRNISLEAATQLVIKASLNQAGQLRRVGIEVGKNTTAQGLLNKLTEAYAGQAARYGREGAGAQERLGVAIQNTQEDIAQGLLPAVTDLSNQISDWLGKSENQERIQKDVNDAVKAGTSVVKGLAGALKVVKAAAEPVVDALGGIENTAKAIGLVWVGFKVKALAGFAATALASRRTSAAMIADATAAGRAWDIATRPRAMVVAGPGVPGVPGAPVAPRGRIPKVPPIITSNPALIAAGALLLTPNASGARTGAYNPTSYPRVAALLRKIQAGGSLTAAELDALSQFGGRSISELTAAQLVQLNANLAPQASGPLGGDRARPNQGRPVAQPPRTGGGGGDGGATGTGLTRFQTLTLASQRAANSGDLQAQLRAEKALEAYYAQIASNTKLHGDKLYQARLNLIQQQGRVQSIEDQIAADRTKAEQDAADKRKAHRQKLAAARKKHEAEELKADLEYARSLSIGAQKQLKARFPVGEKTLDRIQAATAAGDKPLTRAEFQALLGDALSAQMAIQQKYAPNFVLEHLTRQTNQHLSTIASGSRFRESVRINRIEAAVMD